MFVLIIIGKTPGEGTAVSKLLLTPRFIGLQKNPPVSEWVLFSLQREIASQYCSTSFCYTSKEKGLHHNESILALHI